MDDTALDQLLRDAGEQFRATHTRSTTPARRSHRPRPRALLPLAAGLVTAAVIVPIALLVPTDGTRAVPAGPTSVTLAGMADVRDVEIDTTWLAVSGGDLGQAARQRIELRRRDDLGRMVTTIPTSYPAGGPGCLALSDDTLLWTDFESIPSDFDPGPPTRWSLWQRNLATGQQRQLASGKPTQSGVVPCPVAGQGWAAWNMNGQVIARDLASGRSVIYADAATPVAITPSGLVEQGTVRGTMQVVLRTGESYDARRVLAEVPRGTEAPAGSGRVLTFAADPASGSAGSEIISSCSLPVCSPLGELRRDPSSGSAVVGEEFAAWSDLNDSPAIVRFDGGEVPSPAPGYVPFATLAAFGDTLTYGTQPTGSGPTRLHVVKINRS